MIKEGDRPADQLLTGQCSWLDRGLRANEPTRIADGRPSADEVRKAAERIIAGDTWTFWVVDDGTSVQGHGIRQRHPESKALALARHSISCLAVFLRHRQRSQATPASPLRRVLFKAALVQALRPKRVLYEG